MDSSAPLWVAQTKYRVLDTMLGRGSLAACGARSHFGHGGGAGVGRVRRARQGAATFFLRCIHECHCGVNLQ